MKKILFTSTLLSSVLLLSVISCKKEKETPLTPISPIALYSVEITIMNDTVDFSTTSNCSEWSTGMDFDSIHPEGSAPDYALQSQDTNCVFTNNRKLTFSAFHDNKLFLNDNLGGNVKKYNQGQTIDYNTVANTFSTSQGNVSARILEEGVTNDFNLNETFYLGTAFLQNGNYYNGWVKVKTLNNYYSCIIVSYGVCKTANTPITAE